MEEKGEEKGRQNPARRMRAWLDALSLLASAPIPPSRWSFATTYHKWIILSRKDSTTSRREKDANHQAMALDAVGWSEPSPVKVR